MIDKKIQGDLWSHGSDETLEQEGYDVSLDQFKAVLALRSRSSESSSSSSSDDAEDDSTDDIQNEESLEHINKYKRISSRSSSGGSHSSTGDSKDNKDEKQTNKDEKQTNTTTATKANQKENEEERDEPPSTFSEDEDFFPIRDEDFPRAEKDGNHHEANETTIEKPTDSYTMNTNVKETTTLSAAKITVAFTDYEKDDSEQKKSAIPQQNQVSSDDLEQKQEKREKSLSPNAIDIKEKNTSATYDDIDQKQTSQEKSWCHVVTYIEESSLSQIEKEDEERSAEQDRKEEEQEFSKEQVDVTSPASPLSPSVASKPIFPAQRAYLDAVEASSSPVNGSNTAAKSNVIVDEKSKLSEKVPSSKAETASSDDGIKIEKEDLNFDDFEKDDDENSNYTGNHSNIDTIDENSPVTFFHPASPSPRLRHTNKSQQLMTPSSQSSLTPQSKMQKIREQLERFQQLNACLMREKGELDRRQKKDQEEIQKLRSRSEKQQKENLKDLQLAHETIQMLQRENEELRYERDDESRASNDDADDEIDELTDSLEDCRKENERLASQKEKMKEALAHARQVFVEEQQSKKDLIAKCDQLTSDIDAQRNEVTKAKEHHVTLMKEQEERTNTLQKQNADLQKELLNVRETLNDRVVEIERMKDEQHELQESLNDLQEDLKRMPQGDRTNESSLRHSEQLQKQVFALDEELAEERLNNKEVRDRANEQERELVDLRDKCKMMEVSLEENESSANVMKVQIEKLNDERSNLQSKLDTLDAQHKTDVELLQKEVSQLQKQDEDNTSQIEKLNEELSNRDVECEDLKSKIDIIEEDSKKKLSEVQERLDEVTNNLTECQHHYEEEQSKCKELNQTLTEKIQSITDLNTQLSSIQKDNIKFQKENEALCANVKNLEKEISITTKVILGPLVEDNPSESNVTYLNSLSTLRQKSCVLVDHLDASIDKWRNVVDGLKTELRSERERTAKQTERFEELSKHKQMEMDGLQTLLEVEQTKSKALRATMEGMKLEEGCGDDEPTASHSQQQQQRALETLRLSVLKLEHKYDVALQHSSHTISEAATTNAKLQEELVSASREISKHKNLSDEYSYGLESAQRKCRYLEQEVRNLQEKLNHVYTSAVAEEQEEAAAASMSLSASGSNVNAADKSSEATGLQQQEHPHLQPSHSGGVLSIQQTSSNNSLHSKRSILSADLVEERATLSNQLRTMTHKASDLQAVVDRLETNYSRLEKERDELREEKQTLAKHMGDLSKRLKEVHSSYKDIMSSGDEAHREMDKLALRNKELERLRKTDEETISDLKSKVQTQTRQIESLEENNYDLDAESTAIRVELKVVREREKQLQSDLEVIEVEKGLLLEEHSKVQKLMQTEHESEKTQLNDSLKEREQRIAQLTSKVDDLASANLELEECVTNFKGEIANFKNVKKLLEDVSSRTRRDYNTLERECEELEAKLVEVETLFEAEQSKSESLDASLKNEQECSARKQGQVTEMEQKIESLTKELATVKDKNVQMATRFKSFESTQETLESQIEELKTSKKPVQEEVSQLREELKQAHDSLDEMAISKSNLEKELVNSLQSRGVNITQLQSKLKEAQQSVVELEQKLKISEAQCNKLKDLPQQLELLQNDMQHLQDELDAKVNEMRQFEDKKLNRTNILEEERDNLSSQLKTLETRLEESMVDLEDEQIVTNSLREDKISLTKQIGALEQSLESARQELEHAMDSLQTRDEESIILKDRLETLKKDDEALQQKLQTSTLRIDELESLLEDVIEDKKKQQSDNFEKMELQVKSLKVELEESKRQIKILNDNLDEAEDGSVILKAGVTSKQHENEELKQTLKDADEHIATLEQDLNDAVLHIEELESQLEANSILQQDHKALQKKFQTTESRAKKLQNEVDQLKNTILQRDAQPYRLPSPSPVACMTPTTAERKMADARARLQGQQREIEALKKQLKRAQQDNNELQREMDDKLNQEKWNGENSDSDRIDDLTSAIDRLRSENDELLNEIHYLNKQIRDVTQEKKELEQELKENNDLLHTVRDQMKKQQS